MRAWVPALALAVVTSACSDGGGGAATPSESPPASASAGGFEALRELAESFGCEDVQDVGTGGNPGLTAFGVCHIGRDNVDIYMTSNRALWEHIAQQFPSVLGPGWIVVCPTGARTARLVHDRIGGELVLPRRG